MHFTHASIFRVEPCSLDSKQVKLHLHTKSTIDVFCACRVHISSSQTLHNKYPIMQLIVWPKSWAAQIWSGFCGSNPKVLLFIPGYIVREKVFAMLTIQILLLCLIPTSLAQVGVFFIFSEVGLVVEIIISIYHFEQINDSCCWKKTHKSWLGVEKFQNKLLETSQAHLRMTSSWKLKRPRARARSGWVW